MIDETDIKDEYCICDKCRIIQKVLNDEMQRM